MLFRFKFIFPNLSYIESEHPELIVKKIIWLILMQAMYMEKMWQMNANDYWDFHFDKAGR